jgi:hypothetical protein
MIKVIPCKYCKRGRIKIHNTNVLGSQIVADKCIYCEGKGFIREDGNINKLENTKSINNLNNEKGGNLNDGILDKK